MNRGPRLGPHSLDAALEIAKRLQLDLQAELTAVDTDPGATTIFLSVPPTAVGDLIRRRRARWMSLMDESVRRRKGFVADVESRLSERRVGLGASRASRLR